MTKMPTPFLFRKAEKPTTKLTELKEPQIDLVSGGSFRKEEEELINTMTVTPDGSSWCATDDESMTQ